MVSVAEYWFSLPKELLQTRIVSSRMTKGFSGLPAQPITESITETLNQHPDLTFCYPIYSLAEDPDSVVVITLAKGNRAYFFYFNPEDKQWEQLMETDRPEAITDEIPVAEEEINDQLRQHYDDQDLEPAGYPGDPVLGTVHSFPNEPLTDTQIGVMLEQHPMMGEVMPLVNTADGDRTIALIFFYNDFLREQRITAAAGYEPTISEWQLIASVESSDPDFDQALEQLQTAYAQWVGNHYTIDEIHPIEDPEAALKS
jgi:hypothetical protein